MRCSGSVYEWTHYLIHSDYKPKTRVYRAIWRNHRQHHYKNEHYWFTVTSSGTADRVLGTYPDPAARATSPTAKNLHAERARERVYALHDDRVADADGVEVPGRIVGAEVDAAVADVRIAL